MKRTTKAVNEIKELGKSEKPRVKIVDFLPTGSVNLNLAASQKGRDGGWARGHIINIVGDSSSGKTLLALETCANSYYFLDRKATRNFKEVKNLKIVYNNPEGVMDFPIAHMYGQKFYDDVEWIQTSICQEFGRDFQRRVSALKDGECLIYVIDSLDSLISAEEKARVEKSVKSGEEIDGSYRTEKAKYFSSAFFNDLCGRMKGKDATLICISQVRENLNAGLFGKKHYRTGGKALDFYSHQVCWLYTKEKLKKTKNRQERIYGVRIQAKFEKNKVAVPFREAQFIILFDYGLDNILSMIHSQYGPKVKEIVWGEEKYKLDEFIASVEEDDELYEQLVDMVETEWYEIESAIKPKRKERFTK